MSSRRRRRKTGGKLPQYTDEQRQEALDMMKSGKTMKQTAAAVGASLASLTNWKKAARGGKPGRPRGRRAGSGSSAGSVTSGSGAVKALASVVSLGLDNSELKKLQALLAAYLD